MVYYYDDDKPELYHFGIKGMKWGVRKKRDWKSAKRLRLNAIASEVKKQNRAYVNRKGQIRSRGQLVGRRVGIKVLNDIGLALANRLLLDHGFEQASKLTRFANVGLSFVNGFYGVKEQVQYRSALEKSQE